MKKNTDLTSALVMTLRALWSTVLLTLTSLIEQRNASGYNISRSHTLFQLRLIDHKQEGEKAKRHFNHNLTPSYNH